MAKEAFIKNNKIDYEGMNDDIDDFAYENIIFNTPGHELFLISYHYTLKIIDATFRDIKNKQYRKFHIPLNYEIDNIKGGRYFYKVNYSEKIFIDINEFISWILDIGKFNEEARNLRILFEI